MKTKLSYSLIVASALVGGSMASSALAGCPAITVNNNKGITGDSYRNYFEKAEYEKKANCKLSYSENPDIAKLNKMIMGNGALPPVSKRLPSEPLVIAPYETIGKYGGTWQGISANTESGTSENLDMRFVSLVRWADDQTTIVPYVAKSFKWNSDFTKVTFTLRKGHKWSDGSPFTAHDIAFWYNYLIQKKNVREKVKSFWKTGDDLMAVKAINDTTVEFSMSKPKPSFLSFLASTYAETFQPKAFLSQFHPKYNKNANALAQKAGFKDGYEAINFYYNASDWKDTPTPYLKDPSMKKVKALGGVGTVPTLESFIVVEDTSEGRKVVANPYFFVVDTQGNQLPYLNAVKETYIKDPQLVALKLLNGEAHFKNQNLDLSIAPDLLEGASKPGAKFKASIAPWSRYSSFFVNLTHKDPELRKVFNNVKFRQSISHAFNREEISETVYFGEGKPIQHTSFAHGISFVPKSALTRFTEYDVKKARAGFESVGLTDKNGDGFYELPSGKPINLVFTYSPNYVAAAAVELMVQQLNDAGLKTILREVTNDDFRAAASAGSLDIGAAKNGNPPHKQMGQMTFYAPPYGGFFDAPSAVGWAKYLQTNGKDGIKPPQWAYDMIELATKWQKYPISAPEHAKYGAQLAEMHSKYLPFIGIVQTGRPAYRNLQIGNLPDDIVMDKIESSYNYQQPYAPEQYYLK